MTLLLFVDRGKRAERYPWFEWKVRLFLAGAALGIVGMASGMDWLVAVAVVVLAAALLLRFLPGGRGEAHDATGEGDSAS